MTNHNGKAVELARTLHGARTAYATLCEDVEKLRQKLEQESRTWREMQRTLILAKETKGVVKAAEQDLRDFLVEAFVDTKAKNFGEGLEVMERVVAVIFDEPRMMDWIVEKARYLLSVDEKELAKLLKSKGKEVPGARLEKRPVARIAKDLSKYE